MSFLDQMEELLDQHDYATPEVGDIRTGIIVAVTPQGVILDLGVKRDGLVPPSDLAKLEPGEREALHVNDEINVYIVNTDQPDSLTVSIHLARLNQDWIEAEALLESGEVIEAEVIGYNKGGAIVPYGRLRGFIPISHLVELSPGMNDRKRQQRLAKLRGEKLPLKVIEVNRRRRRLVLSQRDAQREWEEKRKEELLSKLQEGDVLAGRVSGLRDFGIFVDLGGADGLVHISELAWHRVDHPREVVKVGDEIEVYVLKLDRSDQRISLSRKRLLPNPWDTVEERYDMNQLVEGTVTRIVDYGAFAEIEPGVEGLLHVSQLSRGNVENVGEVVQEGETHLLRVVSIDSQRQRIGLSLKAVTATEQIEWMAQREAAAAEAAAEAEAEAEADVEEEPAVEVEVAEAVETEAEEVAEAEPVEEVSEETAGSDEEE
ncbi:MAG: S1 RNA-binding domain-containing protein [Ardenticatenaceae bacterium]|nr:S1 RNA-binding domain-containing protein [Ardenticatenaceae bacterium]MCB8991581.1 S1 RNA-binding domain-containing protein [Ardenticatenaceae bacterium]MCB9004210.1 S1 RNA-binding domain-containing protein [Ardenticatenaceae bacterium]